MSNLHMFDSYSDFKSNIFKIYWNMKLYLNMISNSVIFPSYFITKNSLVN